MLRAMCAICLIKGKKKVFLHSSLCSNKTLLKLIAKLNCEPSITVFFRTITSYDFCKTNA